jgi:hypothetical protein
MKLNLQDSVASRQDLKALVLEIRKYAEWFSRTSVKMHFSADNSPAAPALSAAATSIIKAWDGDKPLTQKSLDDLIATLEDFENTAPHITITLGAAPPGEIKKLLVAWCRKNIDPGMLVDIRFNATLLGGMVVRYGSHVYDWSFRRQILAARETFPEILRRV